MALSGKIAVMLEIKSINGNAFYNLWDDELKKIPSMSPNTIQECKLDYGQAGSLGALYRWKFFHDGKTINVVTMTDTSDYDNNMVTYENFEGDLKELYKTLFIRLNVDVQDETKTSWVTWTFEYEKLNADVPDPDTLVEIFKKATKDIDTYYLQTESEE